MTPDDRIQRAALALAEAAGAPVRVILFGSQARGDSSATSDVDFLVIQRDVRDRFEESVRLAQIVADLRVPADVVVVTEAQVEEWRDLPGTMIHDALAEGRVLAEA